MQRRSLSPLSLLDAAALAHGAKVAEHLRQVIRSAQGWLSFERWMAEALYAPGLGYYTAGSVKLASSAAGNRFPAGDFVTAPELTPLFAQTLARQVAQILSVTDTHTVLEFGAGSGALAEGMLQALLEAGIEVHYRIIEVSADLRERQQRRLAHYGERIQWLDALPPHFAGCVLANEVLDAMPVSLFRWDDTGRVLERGVTLDAAGAFSWQDQPAGPILAQAVIARTVPMPGYISEINLQAEAWLRAMGDWLERGAALLLDYGFPRHEYYHPQRTSGTLMCHLRHHAQADPLFAPGLQDITAHIDYTAMATAACQGGLAVLGYTTQARFLLNAGLMELVGRLDPTDAAAYALAIAPVQKLLSEAEMGELFKVIAVGRQVDMPLLGFQRGDRRAVLL